MSRRAVFIIAGIAGLAAAAIAAAQEFTPPPGVKMQINLYPITNYRGNPEVITESTPRIRRPIDAESMIVTRGIWKLCGNINYLPPCTTVSETKSLAIPLTVRSAMLVGDQGNTFQAAPVSRFGPDIIPEAPIETAPRVARVAPIPTVAPPVAEGGEPGTNPSMKGEGVEFYPAPATNGVRVLACAQGAGNANPRCVQATADTFCAAHGYRDSASRETTTIRGRVYLSNVLCKSSADPGASQNEDRGGFRIPFLGR